MKIEIKSICGSILFEGDFSSFAEAVEAAVSSGADLSCANLSGANLSCADLSCANLSCANLSRANLSGANLSGADLSRANLSCANLSCADLSCANLSGADLSRADLSRADLSGADLSRAYLSGANLSGADLSRANLSCANLSCANLSRERQNELYPFHTILPEGDLIGYKKLRGGVIAKLSIPAAAKRVGGMTGRKCRAEYAIVLEGEGVSKHDSSFKYAVGATVRPVEKFDEDLRNECRSGIHFFITRAEAEAYD